MSPDSARSFVSHCPGSSAPTGRLSRSSPRAVCYCSTPALSTLLLAALSLSACRPSPSPPAHVTPAHSPRPASPAPAPPPETLSPASTEAAAEISLVTTDRQQLAQLIERYRGQVVLVDFWATWCVPCREGFKHLAHWRQKWHAQGLRIITVSLDDEAGTPDALGFLREQQAHYDNLRSVHGGGDRSFDDFEIDHGAVPHLQLYDRQGRRVKKFLSGDPQARPYTAEDVEQAIEQLLREAA